MTARPSGPVGAEQRTTRAHQQQMIDALNAAMDTMEMTQAELARRTGHTTKHVNQVLTGRKTASPAALDYWAFTLGCEWHVELDPIGTAAGYERMKRASRG